MSESVIVRTGARLHFGLLAVDPPVGRRFGGAGMMVSPPGFHLRATTEDAADDVVTGAAAATAERILEFVRRARAAVVAEQPLPALRIDVRAEIPSHGGLGSGTQLGLAVASLVRYFARRAGGQSCAEAARPAPATELARDVGRGARSSIGIHGFDLGGFLVEAGKHAGEDISPLVLRIDVPEAWRFLLVRPPHAAGLSGEAEHRAFRELGSMSPELTGRLCRIVLMDWAPALQSGDFAAASEALYQFGRAVGEYFAPVQGGAYADPQMRILAEELRRRGIAGVAQTSWGPTLAIACPNAGAAETLQRDLHSRREWSDCRFECAAPLNRGAEICAEG